MTKEELKELNEKYVDLISALTKAVNGLNDIIKDQYNDNEDLQPLFKSIKKRRKIKLV